MSMTMVDARERAIRDLTRHCGNGRLTLDELEERIEEVHAATTDDEIRHALRELPVVPDPDPEPVRAERSDQPYEPEPASYEHVRPDAVFMSAGKLRRDASAEPWEKSLGMACTIGGFVLLFNAYERPQPTPADKILRAEREALSPGTVDAMFDEIGLLVLEGD
ncbi:MAG: hypothetical protein QOD30_519, partial [Actinomycetota bacterium]|nr:hypothetical protein [Actinomycetota bacterium]